MIEVEKIKPTGLFTNYIYKAIPLAFDESMSYYETLCGLLAYLKNTVKPALNNNADAIIEVQNLITELQNYVDNYFDNLDVQEEINNKLDEMAESGQLTDIIAQYLQLAGVLGFDTLNDLKRANNIVNGSICKTLGLESYNDGKGAYYKIRQITSEDDVDEINIVSLEVSNQLIAEKIKTFNIQNENYIENLFALPYRTETDSRVMQGGCYCGNNEIAVFFESTNTIQIINTTTGSVLREYSNEVFGHGNSITKIDNYLYLLGTGNPDDVNCYKIPYDTLNSYETITVVGDGLIPSNENISSIAYSSVNEKVYILTYPQFPNIKLYEFDKTLSNMLNSYTISNSNEYGGFVTDMCCWKEYILINYNYGKLQLIDTNTMTLYKAININLNSGNRYYSEIEFIDNIDNEELIVGSLGFTGDGYGIGNNFFGTINLFNSYRSYPIGTGKGNTSGKFPKNNVIYVDTDNTSIKRDGSINNPFNSIYEACNSCLIDGFEKVDIYLKGTFTNQSMYLHNLGVQVRVYPWTDTVISIKDIDIQNTSNVLIKNIIPITLLTLKETNLFFTYDKSTPITLNLNGYNTSNLKIQGAENMITFSGQSLGTIENVIYNNEKGIVGIHDNINDTYINFINCRDIKNMKQRCRLDGIAHNPTTSLKFFTSILIPKNIWIQVGAEYYSLPITGQEKTYNMPITGDTLNVNISYDTTTYDFTTYKYELTTTSTNIYDAYIDY